MPTITLNGKVTSVPVDVASLADLLEHLKLAQERVALEQNGSVIPRKLWNETSLTADDRIEIVHFVGGG